MKKLFRKIKKEKIRKFGVTKFKKQSIMIHNQKIPWVVRIL